MVYMLTFGGILMVNVTIYSSTMDPMGITTFFRATGIQPHHPHPEVLSVAKQPDVWP